MAVSERQQPNVRIRCVSLMVPILIAVFAGSVTFPRPGQTSAGTQTPIPASFFGMTTLSAEDYPSLPIGALGHPSTFAWGWIERAKGVYTWSGFDSFVADALSHQVDLVITFGDTPGWAAADPSTCKLLANTTVIGCTSPPAQIQDWTDFITQVATHFKGQVAYCEPWNERPRRRTVPSL